MINLNFNPVFLDLGFIQIRYYGLIFALGFLAVLFYLLKKSKKGDIDLKEEQIYDVVFYLILGILIGARIFHVVFWDFAYYLKNPIKIFYLWEGGLSFHGGLIGALISVYWYCKRQNINLMKLADVLTMPAILMLALGRIANFINQELLGTITNLPWCVRFLRSYDPVNCRHPVQLYAALGRFAAFLMLFKIKRPKKDGFIFFSFIILFGFGRFFLDFLREDKKYLLLSAGQWLSLIMLTAGFYVIFRYYKEDLTYIFKPSKQETGENQ